MLKAIIKKAEDITNVRGRYKFSAALVLGEVSRIVSSRKFALNYGRAEWLAADSKSVNSIEIQEMKYEKLVLCLIDGSTLDIVDAVKASNLSTKCIKNKSLTITRTCGIISIDSQIGIKAVRSVYELSDSEKGDWLVRDRPQVLIAYLRWQLLADIQAANANVAYAEYVRQLQTLESLEIV